MDHASQLLSRLLRFSAATRLYRLEIAGQPEDRFLVEAWAAVESLHAVGATELIVLSLDTEVAARSLLGSLATLNSRLAEGGMCRSTGLIHEVAKLGGDGGFGRYRLRMAPWPWLLSQASTSRVWQDKTLIEVVEDVFREFPQHADWHWSADALTYLARVPPRSYTVQYRQTHLDFISRLLAGEGLSWRIEEHAPGPQGHRLVIFADSTARSAFPEDPTSAAHDGIRFQGARELDQQDGIQALAACRSLQAASCTLLSYDYRNKQAITASIPTHHDFGGRDAPRLESYDSAGPVTDDKDAADRHARLMMEAAEARNKRWLGRSTVRSLRAGARFSLTVQARDQLQVVSANAGVTWAAARKITLATAGGASIVIDGGNITVLCPGTLTVHAGQKLLEGAARMKFELPLLPKAPLQENNRSPFSK